MEAALDPVTIDHPASSPDTTGSSIDVTCPLSVHTDYSDEFDAEDNPDDPITKRPGSSSRRDRKQKQLSPRSREALRLKINHRERERMHDLNSSMDALRQVMPYAHGPSVKKLSKMATLLLARNYIILLTRSVEEMRRLLAEAYRSQNMPPGMVAPTLPGVLPPGLRLPNLDKNIPGVPGSLPGFPTAPSGLLSGMPGGIPPPVLPPQAHLTSTLSPSSGLTRTSEGSIIPPVSVSSSAPHVVHHPMPTMALGGLAARNGSSIPSMTPHPLHLHHLSSHYAGGPCSCVYCHLAAKTNSDSLLKQA